MVHACISYVHLYYSVMALLIGHVVNTSMLVM